MYAGTLAKLASPADEPFASSAPHGELPALVVEETQDGLNGRPVQSGIAAAAVTEKVPDVTVSDDGHGNLTATESTDVIEHDFVTEWVADPTGTGLVIAESVRGDGELAFPLDQFRVQGDGPVDRLGVMVDQLFRAWDDEGDLADVWMAGHDDFDGTSIDYHDNASRSEPPSIGVGFERHWGGVVFEGVVYHSGYVACYDADSPPAFVRFVADEILPHAFVKDDDGDKAEGTQSTLGGGGE